LIDHVRAARSTQERGIESDDSTKRKRD
jgi:hypothetical protein